MFYTVIKVSSLFGIAHACTLIEQHTILQPIQVGLKKAAHYLAVCLLTGL